MAGSALIRCRACTKAIPIGDTKTHINQHLDDIQDLITQQAAFLRSLACDQSDDFVCNRPDDLAGNQPDGPQDNALDLTKKKKKKSTPVHECPESGCHQAFPERERLYKHRYRHYSGQRCTHCEFSYFTASAYINHKCRDTNVSRDLINTRRDEVDKTLGLDFRIKMRNRRKRQAGVIFADTSNQGVAEERASQNPDQLNPELFGAGDSVSQLPHQHAVPEDRDSREERTSQDFHQNHSELFGAIGAVPQVSHQHAIPEDREAYASNSTQSQFGLAINTQIDQPLPRFPPLLHAHLLEQNWNLYSNSGHDF